MVLLVVPQAHKRGGASTTPFLAPSACYGATGFLCPQVYGGHGEWDAAAPKKAQVRASIRDSVVLKAVEEETRYDGDEGPFTKQEFFEVRALVPRALYFSSCHNAESCALAAACDSSLGLAGLRGLRRVACCQSAQGCLSPRFGCAKGG